MYQMLSHGLFASGKHTMAYQLSYEKGNVTVPLKVYVLELLAILSFLNRIVILLSSGEVAVTTAVPFLKI